MSAAVYKAVFERLLQVDSTKHIQLCCLCLNWSGEDAVSINDEVVISIQPGHPVRRKISLLLKFILDARLYEIMHILKSVCKQCLMSTITSYKFVYHCSINAETLCRAVETVEKSLTDLPDDSLNCNSLYITINPAEVSEKSVTRFYDKKRLFVPKDTALMRFQRICENVYPATLLCSKLDITIGDILYNPEKPHEYKCKLCKELFNSYTSLRVHYFRIHCHSYNQTCKECYNHKTTTFNKFDNVKLRILSRNEIDSQRNIGPNYQKDSLPLSSLDQDVDIPQYNDDVPSNLPVNEDMDIPASKTEVYLSDNHKKTINYTRDDMSRNEIDRQQNFGLNEKDSLNDNHKQTIHNTRDDMGRFVCEKCNRKFRDLNRFKEHKLKRKKCTPTHRKKGDYYCDYCHRHFRRKYLLALHIRFEHMGEKGFICEVCAKRFPHASRLKTHMMTHTGEKNFICPKCGKRFMSKQKLESHIDTHSEARRYQCTYCDMTLKSYLTLYSHIKRMHKPVSYKCDICLRSFRANTCLSRHRKLHYDSGSRLFIYKNGVPPTPSYQPQQPTAGYCLTNQNMEIPAVESEDTLNKNQKSPINYTSDDMGAFVCEKCNAKFRDQNQYLEHRLKSQICTSQNNNDYYCDYCNRHFRSKYVLAKHIRFEHLGEKGFICEVCAKRFPFASRLKTHMMTHTGEKNFICPKCGKRFMFKHKLDIHMTSHSEARNYTCIHCGKAFKTHKNLYHHIIRKHTSITFKCDICLRSFGARSCLSRHKKLHYDSRSRLFIYKNEVPPTSSYQPRQPTAGQCLTNKNMESPAVESEDTLNKNQKSPINYTSDDMGAFVCEKCNAKFRDQNQYLEHRLKSQICTSQNSDDYYCDYCNRHFRRKYLLAKHIRFQHLGEQELICEVCAKSFREAYMLRHHKLLHTGEKNFICSTCGEGFLYKRKLDNHMARHSEARNYPCIHCDKAFQTHVNLYCHIRRKHTSISYKCDICLRSFGASSCLSRHKKLHYDSRSRLFIYKNGVPPTPTYQPRQSTAGHSLTNKNMEIPEVESEVTLN